MRQASATARIMWKQSKVSVRPRYYDVGRRGGEGRYGKACGT